MLSTDEPSDTVKVLEGVIQLCDPVSQ
jgi:hypothetical protein